jgi:hypothetical protein
LAELFSLLSFFMDKKSFLKLDEFCGCFLVSYKLFNLKLEALLVFDGISCHGSLDDVEVWPKSSISSFGSIALH